MHVTKNYNTDGGDKTVIGGILAFEGEGSLKGFPGAKNQPASTATQISGLKNDFNDLLLKLKEAGVMEPDEWNISATLASPTDVIIAANNAKAIVSYEDGVITITVDTDTLEESAGPIEEQGMHKWICLGINTGLSSITQVEYNGELLTEDDVTVATACGCAAGTFALYVKAEIVETEGKTFTLKAAGYPEIEISVTVVRPDV